MSAITLAALLIIGLFTVLLLLKNSILKKFTYCTICLAVSLTWIILLLALWSGWYNNQLVIGILMGQSSLGVYYLLEKMTPRPYLVYRLPTLLTLTVVAYSAVSREFISSVWVVVAITWLVTVTLYTYRAKPRLQSKVKAIIECCSDW